MIKTFVRPRPHSLADIRVDAAARGLWVACGSTKGAVTPLFPHCEVLRHVWTVVAFLPAQASDAAIAALMTKDPACAID